MGQDSLNLMYGKSHPAKVRKGTEVNVHPNEGYPGKDKNSKVKIIGLKANGNPKDFGPGPSQRGKKMANEQGVFAAKMQKRRK